MEHVIYQEYEVGREQRQRRYGHRSLVVWLTGLSGSGKSTIANRVGSRLFADGKTCYVLDGDNVRRGLNADLDFSEEGRRENLRRIAEVARLFTDAGSIVLCAFISPLRSDREQVRRIIGVNDFLEIFVDAPLDLCISRDVKGLYRKARTGIIKNFTGVSAEYQKPETPDLTINTATTSLDEAAGQLLQLIHSKI